MDHLNRTRWDSRDRPILGVLQDAGQSDWTVEAVPIGLGVQPDETTYRVSEDGLPHLYVYMDEETQVPMVETQSFKPGNGHYGTALVRMEDLWPPQGSGWKLESYLTLNLLGYGGPYVVPDCPVWLHEDMTVGNLRKVIQVFENHDVEYLGLQTFSVTEPILRR